MFVISVGLEIAAFLYSKNTAINSHQSCKGPFNNYVDKMRGEGVKMSVFVHAQGIKTVQAGVRVGQKMAKFCPRSC